MAIVDNNIDKEPKWYALHVYSGYENIAKQNLEITIDKYGLENRIFKIVIPMEDELVEKRGKKVLVPKKTMPGYILVKMIYGDDLWHHVTRTRGITGFVGPKGRPLAMTEEEVMKMRLERISSDVVLELNDKVEVVDGPLNTMIGTILELDKENQRLKISVELFGRDTVVDLDFAQVRKID